MKKIYVLMLAFLMLSGVSYAGGIVTNTNQSAAWVRMVSRDACTDVDAVFYNPAGLTQLEDGFYVQLNNQTISQTRKIVNKYPYLNNDTYIGDVFVPVLPTAFVAYKKGNWAFSGGFTVIGGGGGADYAAGLPSFETTISTIPLSLKTNGIPTDKYSSDISFNGTSAYFGLQVGAAYKVNDWLSLALGVRYVMAKNTYKGYIRDIKINPNYPAFGAAYTGGLVSAPTFFKDAATYLNGMSTNSTAMAAGLGQVVAGGGGAVPLANGTAAGLSALQVGQAQALIAGAGQSSAGLTIAQAQTLLTTVVVPTYKGKADAMTANAAGTANKEVDVAQDGSGYCPILSANINLLDKKLNIAIKYEGKTSMKVKNKTTIDQTATKVYASGKTDALFPDGKEIGSDVPALLTIGANYKLLPNFRAQVGFHYYFDRNADYGKVDVDKTTGVVLHTGNEYFIEKNSIEASLGLEFDLNDKLLLSVGYLYASTSPAIAYQTDMSYSLKSQTIGFGGCYKISPNFNIDLGILYTSYTNGTKDINYGVIGTYNETYYKTNVMGSIGLTYNFGKK